MSTYFIGDIHGCYNELQLLLSQVKFNPNTDQLWLTGDLVARGPCSLEVLCFLQKLGKCVKLVLGNHDLHLLAIYAGKRRNKPKDLLNKLLASNKIQSLIDWLRCQPLVQIDEVRKIIMSHAGITPQWDIQTVRMCANEIELMLSSNSYQLFLDAMYGDFPSYWSPQLTGLARLRFSTNALTRMRYCLPSGELDMTSKELPDQVTPSLQPWFRIPRNISSEYTIIFGHWAALAGKWVPKGIIALDTGCCWGGCLTMLRWEDKKIFVQPALGFK
ncbi:bis(5'-nucleosyl)-tetraphosphatase (symmetrical) ApaH [Candidatus Erwinia haradaeae]|uniref:Bis(5'-nucleosyl)-tetraphosphatase, symmetrical n=1 Tax=Candidatus Erwinia haradaeae TaxID=1922217 RepID=A0A451DFY4_9GAMM|nr:bis(5'-nucleosyl)-tetraphosphatase (symmetrical) ApaH [Candidatus Erwinia haradaeae]VFP85536.1 Bis(5'-nucleosyl)-tetraphosphatase [symmetrical] [Candidatus Erwinia haradaeae]